MNFLIYLILISGVSSIFYKYLGPAPILILIYSIILLLFNL